jgi:hypothetical protein
MKRKRMYNTIRTDLLEDRVAHYESVGNWESARAILWLAESIGAPIDKEKIAQQANERRQLYERDRN